MIHKICVIAASLLCLGTPSHGGEIMPAAEDDASRRLQASYDSPVPEPLEMLKRDIEQLNYHELQAYLRLPAPERLGVELQKDAAPYFYQLLQAQAKGSHRAEGRALKCLMVLLKDKWNPTFFWPAQRVEPDTTPFNWLKQVLSTLYNDSSYAQLPHEMIKRALKEYFDKSFLEMEDQRVRPLLEDLEKLVPLSHWLTHNSHNSLLRQEHLNDFYARLEREKTHIKSRRGQPSSPKQRVQSREGTLTH